MKARNIRPNSVRVFHREMRVSQDLLGRLAGVRDLRMKMVFEGGSKLVMKPTRKEIGWPVRYTAAVNKSPLISIRTVFKLFNRPYPEEGEYQAERRPGGEIVADFSKPVTSDCEPEAVQNG